MPKTYTMVLEGKTLDLPAPASGKHTDMCIKLDSDMLKVVLDYLQPDLAECLKPDAKKKASKRRG